MCKPFSGDGPCGGLEAWQRGHVVALEGKSLDPRLFDQTGPGAAHHGIGHMRAAIGGGTGPGNEAVAGRDLAAVGVQGAGDARAQPLHGLASGLQGVERRWHHSDSSTALATICGLTAMSGCTPIMRRVCCTTSLNTGAATAPP